MKKLLSLSIFTAYSVVGMAQLPVSTTAENKNAVLEEFTGIYCTYCPDGHKRAQTFHDQNPGDVVLVNIHAGGYANPSGGDPDFRTPWGAAIDGQAGVAGYPAGTINRRVFTGMQQGSGTAMSRGDWATAGATVMGESSYVNMAIEGDIDYATNTLTVDVETYFTSAAPGSTVKLNIAVLQSNIAGPQTGMSANPAQVVNGEYIHNHMLRHLMTGQWGVDIATTTSTVGSYQYTWTIPTDINGVAVSVGDLEIVGFITETTQNVVTGTEGPVSFTLPAGVSTADAEAVNSMSSSGGYCQSSITPEFTIKNNESFALDSCEAILTFNGGSPISQWVTNIPANGTKVVTFPAQTLMAGENTISFSTSMSNVYKYFDASSSNNNVSASPVYTLPAAVNNFPLDNGFENDQINAAPTSFLVDDENIEVVSNASFSGITTPMGGYLQSAKSIFIHMGRVPLDGYASMISEKVSLVGGSQSEVQFDYSYAVRGTVTGEELNAYISYDCGTTWIRIFDGVGGSGLETAPASQPNYYSYPTAASDWRTVSAFIGDADGAAEVILKLETKSKNGNWFFIDNIMIDGKPIGLAEENAAGKASVYPNPATDKFFVELQEPTNFNVQLTTVTGQVVRTSDFAKTAKAEINTAGLAKGVYILNVSSDNGSSSQRVTIAD